MFQKSLPSIPVMNQKHPIQNSHLILLIHPFCTFFKQVWGSTFSTMTSTDTGRSGVQISAGTREQQNIQTSSSAHPASNSMKTRTFSLAVKWPV